MEHKQLTDARRCGGLLALMTLALFGTLTVIMRVDLVYIAGWGDAAALAALFTGAYALALALYMRFLRPDARGLLFVGATAAMLMLARAVMLDFETADYTTFLSKWTQVFREGGFRTLAENVGDYNLIYQYILLGISRVPLHDLYLIKWVTVVFDYLLALAMMRAGGALAGEDTQTPLFLIVLALPTVLLDGACWGQCDPVYITFVVLSLYALETDRPYLSAIALSVAFAFKLQTIFFFPVVLLGLIHKRYNVRHAAAFFLAYLVTMRQAMQSMGMHVSPVISSSIELVIKVVAAFLVVPHFGYAGACWVEPSTWLACCLFLMMVYAVRRRNVLHMTNDNGGRT